MHQKQKSMVVDKATGYLNLAGEGCVDAAGRRIRRGYLAVMY